METLLISERCHGLRRKRERYLKSKAVNNQSLLSNACNRALGQSERELLRQKDVSEMQVSDWRLTFECGEPGQTKGFLLFFWLTLRQFSFQKDNGIQNQTKTLVAFWRKYETGQAFVYLVSQLILMRCLLYGRN